MEKTKEEIIRVINECKQLSFEDNFAFPAVIRKLIEAGVERYYADLVKLETTYYWGKESYRIEFALKNPEMIAAAFSEKEMRLALHSIQNGEIDYATFLSRIMKSGVVSYSVYIKGTQVHYVGGKGEIWVEHFPLK